MLSAQTLRAIPTTGAILVVSSLALAEFAATHIILLLGAFLLLLGLVFLVRALIFWEIDRATRKDTR